MDSSDLSAPQARRLADPIARQARYLGRLRRRLDELRFEPTDPLYRAAHEARDAVQGLLVLSRHAGVKNGVGRSSEQKGGARR